MGGGEGLDVSRGDGELVFVCVWQGGYNTVIKLLV